MKTEQKHTIQSIRELSVSELRGGYLALQVKNEHLRAEVERLKMSLKSMVLVSEGPAKGNWELRIARSDAVALLSEIQN